MAVSRDGSTMHLNELWLVDAANELDVAGKVREVWQPLVGACQVHLQGCGDDWHPRQLAHAPPDAARHGHAVLLLRSTTHVRVHGHKVQCNCEFAMRVKFSKSGPDANY